MRKRNPGFGLFAVILGIVIILALILPSQFWWFLFAAALIYFGISSCRCRW